MRSEHNELDIDLASRLMLIMNRSPTRKSLSALEGQSQ
jgi:hypothetical protein